MIRNLILAIFFLGVFFSCKTAKKVEKEELNQTAKSYLDDFNEMVDTLRTYHPALYEFTTKEQFESRITELKESIDNNTSKRDLLWKLEEVIAIVGCSHTNMGFFGSYNSLIGYNEYFPIQARLIKDKFIVVDPQLNDSKIDKGDAVLSINGKPIEEIINTIYAHIHGQAHINSGKKGMLNAFQDLYVPFSLGFPESYTVTIEGKVGPIELLPISKQPSYPPMISPNSPCQKDFCLNELNPKTALLTFRTFEYYGDRTPIYINFLDDTFKTIQEKDYSNLIIDVRGNFGGTSHITSHLLQYILDKPFKYYAKSPFSGDDYLHPFENSFKGKIIVLINGDGFSSVGQLVSILNDKERAFFVGETLGSNQFCTANQKRFQLSNTKFNYTVARSIFIANVRENDIVAKIEPDYYIEQSVDNYFSDKDVVLDKAIEIFEKE